MALSSSQRRCTTYLRVAMECPSSEEEEPPNKAAKLCEDEARTPSSCTLIHGDCVAHMKSLAESSVDLVLADPPYGFVVKAGWDDVKNYCEFSRTWLKEATRILKPGGTLLVYGSPERTWIPRLSVMLEDEFSMCYRQLLTWVYNQGGGSRVSSAVKYAVQHELLLWTCKPGKPWTFNAAEGVEHYREDERAVALAKGKGRVTHESLDRGRPARSFLDFQRENSRSKERSYGHHPSMKPLPLCEHLIKLHSNAGDTVYVPFVGSGSELLSAAKLKRCAIGAEMCAEYVELVKKRARGHCVELHVK